MKLGSGDIAALRLGATEIVKAYLGAVEVYSSAPAGATMTAESRDNLTGYISSAASALFGIGTWGSIAGDTSADGGTVEMVYFATVQASHKLWISGGSGSATSIEIDGTSYALTFEGTVAGYDEYNFAGGTSLFADGVSYELVVT